MPSAGTSPARVAPALSPIESLQPGVQGEITVAPRVRESAHWFFWTVAVSAMDSIFVILGSQIHRFTGYGVSAMADRLSGSSPFLHVMANGWMGAIILFFGFWALEGKKRAFTIGMAVYACDALLLLVARDYFSIPFHAFVLYQLYIGYAALSEASESASQHPRNDS
jgi:hypothetical protein